MVRSVLVVLALGACVCACNPKNTASEPITSTALPPQAVEGAEEATAEPAVEETAADEQGDDSAAVEMQQAEPGQPEPAACESVSKDLPLAERCAAAGAEVHTFPNACVGSCNAVEKGMMCAQALTEGCKCPEGQCIDDDTGCCRAIQD